MTMFAMDTYNWNLYLLMYKVVIKQSLSKIQV